MKKLNCTSTSSDQCSTFPVNTIVYVFILLIVGLFTCNISYACIPAQLHCVIYYIHTVCGLSNQYTLAPCYHGKGSIQLGLSKEVICMLRVTIYGSDINTQPQMSRRFSDPSRCSMRCDITYLCTVWTVWSHNEVEPLQSDILWTINTTPGYGP